MAWEWKEDPPVQTQVTRDPGNDLGSLATMVWTIFFANVVFIVGFGLLVGFANNIVRNSYISDGTVYFYSEASNSAGGYVAGAVLLAIAAVVMFVMGIILLAVRKPYFQEQGLVTATGVVSILGGLFIVSGILSLVLLSKISNQRNGMAMQPPPYGPPPSASSQSPMQPPPVV